MQLGFFGSEISSVAAPNQLNYSLLSSLLTQILRLSKSDKYLEFGRPLFQKLQYSILRVLRSNFLRGNEQLKDSDDVGLIYFPLDPLSLLKTLSPTTLDVNEMERERGRESTEERRGDFSHLLVFQLLRSVLQSVSGTRLYSTLSIFHFDLLLFFACCRLPSRFDNHSITFSSYYYYRDAG